MERKKSVQIAAPRSAQSSEEARPLGGVHSSTPQWRDVAVSLFRIQRGSDAEHDVAAHSALFAAFEAKKSGAGLVGIVGRCTISGCDVHLLTLESGDVIRHVQESEALSGSLALGRAALMCAPAQVLAAVVFEDRIEFVMLDGTSRVAE